MKGITLCADCAYYNMKKHKCTRGCNIDPDVSKGENPSFYVDCPLPDVEPVQKWIPCSERLPEYDVLCLVCMSDKTIHFGKWKGKYDNEGVWGVFHIATGMKLYRVKNVPAWMPLPDAYEPTKEGESDA